MHSTHKKERGCVLNDVWHACSVVPGVIALSARLFVFLLLFSVPVVVADAETAEAKAPAVVEKKGKARDKELVSSIPKASFNRWGEGRGMNCASRTNKSPTVDTYLRNMGCFVAPYAWK